MHIIYQAAFRLVSLSTATSTVTGGEGTFIQGPLRFLRWVKSHSNLRILSNCISFNNYFSFQSAIQPCERLFSRVSQGVWSLHELEQRCGNKGRIHPDLSFRVWEVQTQALSWLLVSSWRRFIQVFLVDHSLPPDSEQSRCHIHQIHINNTSRSL